MEERIQTVGVYEQDLRRLEKSMTKDELFRDVLKEAIEDIIKKRQKKK